MNDFWIWFSTGIQHILDLDGYDHILYIISLCILFSIKDWKKLTLLITAFTIGHSLTLAFSVLTIITIKQMYIEPIIALTIAISCLLNIYYLRYNNYTNYRGYYLNYCLALLFGFVHGMGFSYMLKNMLGKEEDIVFPLLSFNFGLEVGQLMIVCFTLVLSVFLIRFTSIKRTSFIFYTSLTVLIIAFSLFTQRLTNLIL